MAKNTNRPWTEEEVKLLQEYYDRGISKKEISKRLNRTEGSICQKIIALKNLIYQNSNFKIKGKWTEEEVELLKKYLDEGLSYKEIANKLNRTVYSVEDKISYLNNKKSDNLNNKKRWTKEEDELLLQYYNEGVTSRKIAEKLERSTHSINSRLDILFNKKSYRFMCERVKNKNDKSKKYADNHRKYWTKEEEMKLKEYVEKGYSYEDIGKILGRTIESVQCKYLRHIRKDEYKNG